MSPELLNLFLLGFFLFCFSAGFSFARLGLGLGGFRVVFYKPIFPALQFRDLYIHSWSLVISILHPGTIYTFLFMSIPFPPLLFMAIYWIGFLDVGAHPHTESFDNQPRTVSLLYFTFFFFFSFMAVICVCTLFSLFFSCT